MKKLSLRKGIEKLHLAALRFPFTLFFLVGLAVLFYISINNHQAYISPRIRTFFALGTGLSMSLGLFLERSSKMLLRISGQLAGVILLLIYSLFLLEKFEAVDIFQQIALGAVFVLMSFVSAYFDKNSDVSFWEFSKTSVIQLTIAFIFSGVLMAGLSLAVLSLDLLFKVTIHNVVYQNIAISCFALFGPVYFLSNIPPKEEMHSTNFEFNRFLKILGLYILMPILAIYTVILYAYLVQIIIKWELPNGWVSTLVSVLGLGGFVTMHLLFPLREDNKNKTVSVLSEYFPLVLFPLLILMSVGIFRRLGDYGMTINRLYVLLLNGWLYGVSIYLFLTQSKHLKWLIISFSVVLFAASIGPWSVFNLTKKAVTRDTKELLLQSNLLKNGKAIDNSDKHIKVNDSIAEMLKDKIEYLNQTFGSSVMQPFFNDSVNNMTRFGIFEKLGISELKPNQNRTRYFDIICKNKNRSIDITSCKAMLYLNGTTDGNIFDNKDFSVDFSDNTIKIRSKNSPDSLISIDLQPAVLSTFKSFDPAKTVITNELVLDKNKYLLEFSHMNGLYNPKQKTVKINRFEAILFLK